VAPKDPTGPNPNRVTLQQLLLELLVSSLPVGQFTASKYRRGQDRCIYGFSSGDIAHARYEVLGTAEFPPAVDRVWEEVIPPTTKALMFMEREMRIEVGKQMQNSPKITRNAAEEVARQIVTPKVAEKVAELGKKFYVADTGPCPWGKVNSSTTLDLFREVYINAKTDNGLSVSQYPQHLFVIATMAICHQNLALARAAKLAIGLHLLALLCHLPRQFHMEVDEEGYVHYKLRGYAIESVLKERLMQSLFPAFNAQDAGPPTQVLPLYTYGIASGAPIYLIRDPSKVLREVGVEFGDGLRAMLEMSDHQLPVTCICCASGGLHERAG
jgi:hypothetical protein